MRATKNEATKSDLMSGIKIVAVWQHLTVLHLLLHIHSWHPTPSFHSRIHQDYTNPTGRNNPGIRIENEIEKLKAEKIRQYEFYAEGIIAKDEYIKKKQTLCDKIKELEAKKQENATILETQKELLEDSSALKSLSVKFSSIKNIK